MIDPGFSPNYYSVTKGQTKMTEKLNNSKDSGIIIDTGHLAISGNYFTIKTSKGDTLTVSEADGSISIKNNRGVDILIPGQEPDSK